MTSQAPARSSSGTTSRPRAAPSSMTGTSPSTCRSAWHSGISAGPPVHRGNAGHEPEFLTLYETLAAAVATSAPYLARLNAPTPQTKSTTAHFRNTSRALTEVIQTAGEGPGGVMTTVCFDDTRDGRAALAALRAPLIASTAVLPRITGVHLCTTDASASGVKTSESRNRTDIQTLPIGAVLIEGCDLEAVAPRLIT